MGWDIDRFPEKETIENDDIFMCSVCKNVLQDPLQTPCEHYFCKECIEQWLNLGNISCPVDREPVNIESLKPESRKTKFQLNRLKIRCKNHRNGCRLMSTIEDMPHMIEHELNCCEALQQNSVRQMRNDFQRQEKQYKKRILRLKRALKTAKDTALTRSIELRRLTWQNEDLADLRGIKARNQARNQAFVRQISMLETALSEARQGTRQVLKREQLKRKPDEIVQVHPSTSGVLNEFDDFLNDFDSYQSGETRSNVANPGKFVFHFYIY